MEWRHECLKSAGDECFFFIFGPDCQAEWRQSETFVGISISNNRSTTYAEAFQIDYSFA